MSVIKGTITEVLDRGSDFHITYNNVASGGSNVFTIQKGEALFPQEISQGLGKTVQVITDSRNMVVSAAIGNTPVLQR